MNSSKINFVFELRISEEYVTNKEMDQKEEHKHLPDDVSYHSVNEQCRKKSHSQEPMSSVESRAKICTLEEISPYHQDYREAEEC